MLTQRVHRYHPHPLSTLIVLGASLPARGVPGRRQARSASTQLALTWAAAPWS